MSGRRRAGLSPSLFPFLAVLVCTLGTLILLLALVAQNAGDAFASADATRPDQLETASASTAEEIAEKLAMVEAAERLEREIREATWHRQQTVKLRDEQTAELETRRDRLAHLEDHVRRLRLELEALSTEVEAAIDQQGDLAKTQETLDQLLLEIESEKQQIGNLQSDLQSETPRIVIVPHKGPNGTDRRPIYIECGRDGVLIQPGNIRITQAELEPRVGFPNPLEAALRTIRLHSTQVYGDTIAPYPLLVVRPDGILSYGIARAAMSNWDDQFGYELVPAEVDLAFPDSDPVLSNKVVSVVRETVRQREQLALRFGGGVLGGGGGGFGGTGSGVGGGGGGGGGGEPGPLATGGSPSASTLPVLSAAKMSRGTSNGAIGDSNLRGYSALGDDSPASGSLSGNGPMLNAATGPVTDPASTPSGNAATGTAATGAVATGTAATGAVGELATAGPPNANTASADNTNTDQSDSGAGSVGSTATGSSTTGGSGNTTTSSATAQGTGGAQASGQIAQAMQGQPGSGASSTSQPTAGQPSPSVNLNSTMTPPVKRVGKDWALPPDVSSTRGTEMLRIIRVECYHDGYVLIAEGGRGAPTVIPFTEATMNEASLTLATAVRDRVSNWGAAMQGARWQPVLEVTVAPGAEQRFQQMNRLFEGSGLMIQAKGAR